MKVKVRFVDGHADLHVRYPGQTVAQRCYVQLNPANGVLSASYDAEIGNAVPMSVHHGLVLRWGMATLTAHSANALLKEIEPLAQRVLDGFDEEWNGNNTVGVLDDDAQAASDKIRLACEAEWEVVDVRQPEDWFTVLGGELEQARELGITADMDDDGLDGIESREVAVAASGGGGMTGHVVLDGLGKYLKGLRDKVRAFERWQRGEPSAAQGQTTPPLPAGMVAGKSFVLRARS